MTDVLVPRRALLSVHDKTGLARLARGLAELGVEIVSTGSTAAAVRDAGVAVTEVAEVTGFPEILDGRVKTLHPAIHAAILADRGNPAHLAVLQEHGIAPIDLVVANLYPFGDTVARAGVSDAEALEMIDIGGPTMVRAAAKNHAHVGVVISPHDYDGLLTHLRDDGGLPARSRFELAQKAFGQIARYDAEISGWLHRGHAFPPLRAGVYGKISDLRYGENPHQAAAFYAEPGPRWGLASAQQLGGKALSHTNLADADAAWGMATDFDEPCVAIVKHTNPAGLAVAGTLAEAYPRARSGDPVSAFGGIVAANRVVDAATARQITEIFTEVVVAPGYDDDALALLGEKANLRVLAVRTPRPPARPLEVRSVSGGLLVQDADSAPEQPGAWTVPTATKPDDATLAELRFAWQVCKHVKSNAIVLASDRAVVGVGAGQMSRVDSVRIAVDKSRGRAAGAVLASDAFFPFRDGADAALDAGVRAIVQPGGSIRDAEVVTACEERGVPLVLTGRRHFRH
ncbi:MAG: bifunctional phosphoribosylaminoimidazolecarboxamide formyltransferase/IMP cyclohydrolase [Euzebyales bacterium]|nr:bifunctional phosphoribosylaminoimidazolecarboxamide formyltransferase/IMP cyclohydrolase [Euzebyales bacterium]